MHSSSKDFAIEDGDVYKACWHTLASDTSNYRNCNDIWMRTQDEMSNLFPSSRPQVSYDSGRIRKFYGNVTDLTLITLYSGLEGLT